MTEAEWVVSEDPQAMLGLVERTSDEGSVIAMPRRPSFKVSDRKLRLFACAAFRFLYSAVDMPAGAQASLLRGELMADGGEFGTRWNGAWVDAPLASIAAMEAAQAVPNKPHLADLMREIFGYPFRQVVWTEHAGGAPSVREIDNGDLRALLVLRKPWLRWNGGIVPRLAQAAYDERRQDGTLDPDRLAVLADALEEAGCDDDEILFHLRGLVGCDDCEGAGIIYETQALSSRRDCPKCGGKGMVPPGPHVRGCFVLDLLLGKE